MATQGTGDRRAARARGTTLLLQRALLVSVALNVIFLGVMVRGCVGRSRARLILVDGKPICLVRSERAAHKAHETLLAAKKGTFRGKAAFKQHWEDRPQSPQGEKVCTIEEAVALLKPKLDVVVQGQAIEVEGKVLVVVPTRDLAEEVLRGVKAKFIAEGETPLEPQSFEKPPLVTPVQVVPDLLVSDLKTAVQELLKGQTEPEEYVVKPGDAPSNVAAAHHMTVAQLYKLNPDLESQANHDDIHPGDKWVVASSRPRIVVVTKKETTRTAPIPFRVVEEPRDTLPAGEAQVVQAGEAGERKEWIRATWRNDQLVPESVKVIKAQTIREPREKRVLRGTRGAAPATKSGP